MIFFRCLQLLPLGENFFRRIHTNLISEHMWVTMNEFLVYSAGHVFQVEMVRLLGQAGVHDDLQKQVPQLLLKVFEILVVDGLQCFGAFLDQASGQRLVGLLAVPRASVGAAQGGHDFP